MVAGTLYIVATPIGNLKDFTFRAIETLQKVDIIACEDTRVTQKLLNHYDIQTKTISYHKFSEKQRSSTLLEYLQEGKNVALVSDAGTPLISDPGSILIDEVKKAGIKVVPIPGVSAVVTTLSAVSNDGQFAFIGFFPQKNSEIEHLKKYIADFNLVFYESPNRIIKTLELVKEIFGNVIVSVGRELTKLHEDINTFSVDEMITYLKNSVVKGEITFVVHKMPVKSEDIDYMLSVEKLLKEGFSQKDTAKIVSTIFNVKKNDVYKKIIKD